MLVDGHRWSWRGALGRPGLRTLFLVAFLLIYAAFGIEDERQHMIWSPLSTTLLFDFNFYTRAFHDAVAIGDPYTVREIGPGYLYPPQALLLIAPLVMVPWFKVRAALFLLISVLMAILTVVGVARHYQLSLHRVWWWFPLILTYGPFLSLLHVGQINLLVEMAILAFIYFEQKNGVAAAVGLATGICAKFTPVVLLWYLLVRHEFRLVAITVLFIALSALPIVVWLGPSVFATYLDVLSSLSRVTLPNGVVFQSLDAVLATHEFISRSQMATVHAVLTVYLVLVCVVSTAAARRSHSYDKLWIVLLLSTTVAPSVIWYHHYVFLILPILALMGQERLRPWIVLWSVAVLAIVQIDRSRLSDGLLIHLAVHATLLLVLARQVLAVRRGQAPVEVSVNAAEDPDHALQLAPGPAAAS
jgi:hypothetical protein